MKWLMILWILCALLLVGCGKQSNQTAQEVIYNRENNRSVYSIENESRSTVPDLALLLQQRRIGAVILISKYKLQEAEILDIQKEFTKSHVELMAFYIPVSDACPGNKAKDGDRPGYVDILRDETAKNRLR